jgi:hypothetical protein
MKETPILSHDDAPCLGKAEICKRFGFTVSQLTALVKRGRFPAPDLRLTQRCWRWRPSTLAAFERQGGCNV